MKIKKSVMLVMFLIIGMFVISGCASDNNDNSEIKNQNDITGNVVLNTEDNADAKKVVVYFFWGDGCPHCTTQKPFMEELKSKYPTLEIKMYETWKNPQNAQLFSEIAEKYGTTQRGVPATFIGDKFWIGFSDSMKGDMERKILECLDTECIDLSAK